jgi:hypothetical protein
LHSFPIDRFSFIINSSKNKNLLTLLSSTGSIEGALSSLICGKISNDLFKAGFLQEKNNHNLLFFFILFTLDEKHSHHHVHPQLYAMIYIH